MNKLQNRNGLPDEFLCEKRFFELYGPGKTDTPPGWNTPENWKYLEDIPEEKYFGFAVCNKTSYLMIDCDHVFDDSGHLIPWIGDAIQRCWKYGETYWEYSKSKKGLHLFVDLGDYADSFQPISNSYSQIIIDMDPKEYDQLQKVDKAKADTIPKIELFYLAGGRYCYLTGQHKKKFDIATGETAAAWLHELLKIRSEYHAKYGFTGGAVVISEESGAISQTGSKYQLDEETRKRVLEGLRYIPSNTSMLEWARIGAALYNCGFPVEVFDEWSQYGGQVDEKGNYKEGAVICQQYDAKQIPKEWSTFSQGRTNWNEGTILAAAHENGFEALREYPRPQGKKYANVIKDTEKGTVLKGRFNYDKALSGDGNFLKDDGSSVFSYSLLDGSIYVTGASWNTTMHIFSPIDESEIMYILSERYFLESTDKMYQAVRSVAFSNKFHPVRDMINEIRGTWDGVERLKDLFPRFLGAERSEYTTQVTILLFSGIIQRVMNPGCKFDYCPILQGGQGIGKSTLLRLLALDDKYFTDDLKDMGKDSAFEKFRGKTIVELGEMLFTRDTDKIETIKQFLSRLTDNYREPYTRVAVDYYRQCVFIGTTNKCEFLPADRTGNRRFISIFCKGSPEVHPLENEEETRAYIRQCYAEALAIGDRNGYMMKLPPEIERQAEAMNEQATPEDFQIGQIQEFLDNTSEQYVCGLMIWEKVFDPDHKQGKPKKYELQDIAEIMNSGKIDGWERCTTSQSKRKFKTYGRQRAWQRIATFTPSRDSDFIDIAEEKSPFANVV